MAQTSKIGRGPFWAKRVQAGLTLRAGSAQVSAQVAAVLLAGCIATLSSGAVAADSDDFVSQSGKTYILNLDQASHLRPADADPAILAIADMATRARGGHGVIRELAECVLVQNKMNRKDQ